MCQLLTSDHCASYILSKLTLYPRNVYSCFVSLIKKRFVFILYVFMSVCPPVCSDTCVYVRIEVRRSGSQERASSDVFYYCLPVPGRQRQGLSLNLGVLFFFFSGLEVSKLWSFCLCSCLSWHSRCGCWLPDLSCGY